MSRPAVFLDRDGTLIEDSGFISDPDAVTLIPGVAEALRRLREQGWFLVVITNQSGIGRGFYTEGDYRAVNARMEQLLAAQDARIDAIYHCPHHPDTGCTCRKPGTALHREAAARWDLDLSHSWCVGDRPGDLLAARPLTAQAAMVLTGHGRDHRAWAELEGYPVFADLGEWESAASNK